MGDTPALAWEVAMWRETCRVGERLALVTAWLRGEAPLTVLAARFGVSRKTADKWCRRFQAEGAAGLEDRSRAPHRPGRGVADRQVEAILGLRSARPFYGPRKLKVLLERAEPETDWPAASTIGDILRRHGLAKGRRRRPVIAAASSPFAPVTAANDLWGIDFKGWFRTRDGVRCDPLTVTDAYSRYVLLCRIVEPSSTAVAAALVPVFDRCGLPRAIRSDNGPPFATAGPCGLSALSLNWLKMGIGLERIEPGQPQQNGGHERFHRTLKEATSRPPAASVAAQQARFDDFVERFNHERPHEALGQATPASLWRPSPRRPPAEPITPWYDADHAVRLIRGSGEIKWGGRAIFVSQTLAGETVGVTETKDGRWLVRYAHLDLGLIDPDSNRLRRFVTQAPGNKRSNGPRTVSPMSPVQNVTHLPV